MLTWKQSALLRTLLSWSLCRYACMSIMGDKEEADQLVFASRWNTSTCLPSALCAQGLRGALF